MCEGGLPLLVRVRVRVRGRGRVRVRVRGRVLLVCEGGLPLLHGGRGGERSAGDRCEIGSFGGGEARGPEAVAGR